MIPTVLDSFQYFTYVIIIHLGYIFIFCVVFVVCHFLFPPPFLLFILWCFILTQMKRNILQSGHLSNIQPGRQSWVELFINCFLKKKVKKYKTWITAENFPVEQNDWCSEVYSRQLFYRLKLGSFVVVFYYMESFIRNKVGFLKSFHKVMNLWVGFIFRLTDVFELIEKSSKFYFSKSLFTPRISFCRIRNKITKFNCQVLNIWGMKSKIYYNFTKSYVRTFIFAPRLSKKKSSL